MVSLTFSPCQEKKKATPVGEGSAGSVLPDTTGFIYFVFLTINNSFLFSTADCVLCNITRILRCFTHVSPDLVLNVTTKTDTIWSFSSHFTILSSRATSLGPESERCCSLSGRSPSSVRAGMLEVAGGALQPSVLERDLLGEGPPGPLLHPKPGAVHPDKERLLEGLDSRSFV